MGTNDLSWLWAALIGVAATILGTFFGWLLSKPRNRKINIILNKPIKLSEYRSYDNEENVKKGQLVKLGLFMDLVFYNPSDNVKLMRNIRVAFYSSKRKKLFVINVSDLENTTTLVGTIKIPLGIEAINVAPHVGELYKCKVDLFSKEIEYKDSIVKAYLIYDNEKRKSISHKIELPNFKCINKVEVCDKKCQLRNADEDD